MTNIFFLVILLSTPQYSILSRPNPRETLGIGGDGRKIISTIQLKKYPRAAFALVSVGDPPVQVQLHIDTGIPLTWVLPKPGSRYDPLASSSFAYRRCDGLKFNFLIPGGGRDIGCKYDLRLGDKASYVGNLGLETFTYITGYWGYNTMENVIFGVGRTEGGPQAGTGSRGLSVGELSIIRSFGKKFSICIGSFNKFNEGKQLLALGDDAFLMGKAIPFMFTTGMHYGVRMTSIIGMPAFQGSNIACDVPNQKIYVKDIDCNVLYKDELSHPNP